MSCQVDTMSAERRTTNDPYTHLTDEQVRNIKKDPSPFFHTTKREAPRLDKPPREGGRYYLDRYCGVTSEHLVRGGATQPYCWIDNKWSHDPPEEYNTCRGRAHVRWGPNKAGERTRSHLHGESVDRYTTIDMYRRPPTNYSGPVVMDHGRAADGYYAQRNPSSTSWAGSSVPLNRTAVMESVHAKTVAEYEVARLAEQSARESRRERWPHFSEYTEKYLLQSKTEPKLTSLQEKKKHVEMANA